MSKKVRLGLVGTGRIGQIHARTLTQSVPGAEMVAITDVNLDSARSCAAAYGIGQVADDYRRLLDDKSIEAVVICSSTDTHAPFITQAAEAGKHIFCEKPIAADLDTIDAALTAVERAGVKLMLGFNRRFDANHRRIKQAIEDGEIGTPHLLHIISRDPSPPPIEYVRVSGGMFFDMTIHDFDMARYLIGSEVTEIFAAGAVLVDPAIGQAGDVDTAVVTLRYANGAIGTIDNSRRAVYGYDQRVEVFGSEGVVVVGNNTPHNAVYSNTEGVHSALPLYFFLERYTEAYVAEMKAFISAIAQDIAPPVTGLDGRIPVVMGQAAWKSYRENRPVKLSEIGL